MLSIIDALRRFTKPIITGTAILFIAQLVKKLFLKFAVKKSVQQSVRDEQNLSHQTAKAESEWLRVGEEVDKIK